MKKISVLRRTATLLFTLGFLSAGIPAVPQEKAAAAYFVTHKFQIWGALETSHEKMIAYTSFTNGLFIAPKYQELIDLSRCLEQTVPYDQAMAMIDKYYKDNPQLWNLPFAVGIVQALTVSDGPCPGKSPWKALQMP